MKRTAILIAGLSLVALGARANDEKTEAKVESHHDKDGTGKTKKTVKHKVSGHHGSTTDTKTTEHGVSKNISGGTTETRETKMDHDAPGMKGDSKIDSKETIKRDEHGNVVKDEKSTEKK